MTDEAGVSGAGANGAGQVDRWVAEANEHLRRFDLPRADDLLRCALAAEPEHPRAHLLTALLLLVGEVDRPAALDHAYRAVKLLPESSEAHQALGIAFRNLGIDPLAIGHLKRAVELAPDDGLANHRLGLTLIQAGHWGEGWDVYEQRTVVPFANGYCKPKPPGTVEWNDQDLADRTLVVLGEDGHGDMIQYARFLPGLLARQPRRLVLDVRPGLRRLFQHQLGDLPGGDRVEFRALADVSDCDYVVAFGSLAHRFRATPASVNGTVPYLPAPAPGRADRSRPRVGFVWHGERRLASDVVRSTRLQDWQNLLTASGVHWVSLQHGDQLPEEAALLRALRVEQPLVAGGDFLDTAGVVAGLDLVVSVDTSVVHLAGALNCPVWLLNRASGEWRWGWKQVNSPWYPSLRIFNQETLLDWAPVLREVGDALRGVIGGAPH